MEKTLIEIINLIAIIAIVTLPFFGAKRIGYITVTVISFQVITAFTVVFLVFSKGMVSYSYSGSYVTGNIPVRIDYLSVWFIMIISFTFLTGAWYGIKYMKRYMGQRSSLLLHAIAFILVFTALINLCIIQNAIVFLVAWEIMALGSFMLIIFEHYKKDTLKAGINFLIYSHVCILFITLAFIWIKIKTGSYDFAAITAYTTSHPDLGIALFIFFFMGFAIKAGFVPFHAWLPLAHPAAPAHISGIMSGVIIKIGIFGMLRILSIINADFTTLGYFVLSISIITGLYGVMLAIVQHNLKRLLAYHSIENIGIIGIGIGLGCLGMGTGNQWLLVAGFGGALLHTMNHSLFKSLLFFSAGNVYHGTQTMNIDSLGGLIKKMPRTAYLFLIGSLAICGLPPFNGFVSEFFIFNGLFKGLQSNQFVFTLVMLFSILALVLIGGLALICFTKAFGIVFLGSSRQKLTNPIVKEKPLRVFPLYFIALAILLIGVFPFMFSSMLEKITGLFHMNTENISSAFQNDMFDKLTVIGVYSLGFILLSFVLFLIRQLITRKRSYTVDSTWGCGYVGDGSRMQYSASSFIRSYRKLTEPILLIKKEKKIANGLYPKPMEQVTHPQDRIESTFIQKPIYLFRKGLNSFAFLQNGNIQSYILYGFIFIVATILVPMLISKITVLFNFLNNL